jgi:uncharacterized protein with GYD domain
MQTYVILTKFSHDAFTEPREIRNLAKIVAEKIRRDCPGVKWKTSYATLGRFDVVDIVEAENEREVARAALIIRGDGKSVTETLTATAWNQFLESL